MWTTMCGCGWVGVNNMILDSNGNWVIYISVMIVPDALILARIVTCDVIEHCCVEVPTQHDVSICRDGVDVLKWRLNVSAIYVYK